LPTRSRPGRSLPHRPAVAIRPAHAPKAPPPRRLGDTDRDRLIATMPSDRHRYPPDHHLEHPRLRAATEIRRYHALLSANRPRTAAELAIGRRRRQRSPRRINHRTGDPRRILKDQWNVASPASQITEPRRVRRTRPGPAGDRTARSARRAGRVVGIAAPSSSSSSTSAHSSTSSRSTDHPRTCRSDAGTDRPMAVAQRQQRPRLIDPPPAETASAIATAAASDSRRRATAHRR